MADQRLTTYASQIQTELLDSFEANPLPNTPLKALAKTDLVPLYEGANTFREFIRPFKRGDVETLDEFRARASNNNVLTTGTNAGQIASKTLPNKYLDHAVNTVFTYGFDVEGTSGIDAKFNTPERVAARNRKTLDDAMLQFEHEQLAAQMVYADEWIVPDSATITLGGSVTATDTVFEISNAAKVSSGITAGDLAKIGNKRTPNADAALEIIDVALVKTVGADDTGASGAGFSEIAIETDITKFPTAVTLAGPVFKKLKVELNTHASGNRVQIDRPFAITPTSMDAYFPKLRTAARRAFIMPNKLTTYVTPEVFEIMIGSSTSGTRSQIVANDFLGKQVLMTGEFVTYRGLNIMEDANAISRTEANSTTDLAKERHYIWGFERGESFSWAEMLFSTAFDKIPGTAGLLDKLTTAKICDSMLSYQGAIRMFMMPVTVD